MLTCAATFLARNCGCHLDATGVNATHAQKYQARCPAAPPNGLLASFRKGSTTRMNDLSYKLIDATLEWFPVILGFGVFFAFVVWFIKGVGQHRRERQKRIARSALEAKMKHFVYAEIMEPVLPMARAAKYEDPLDQALETAKLGIVTGGGTQTGDGGTIAWVGIDLALADLDGAIEFTRQFLLKLGSPPGSVLEYRVGGEKKIIPIA
jgi:hypothetical protein